MSMREACRVSQIRLRILGESVIQVGETIVDPSATHVFALLLYLAIERGKLVTRSQLASILFPEGSAANAGHNLRQLLYRLRRIGVPLEATGASVRLRAESVVESPESVLKRGVGETAGTDSRGFTLLPSYSPPTEPLSRWLEAYFGLHVVSTSVGSLVCASTLPAVSSGSTKLAVTT